MKRIRLKPVQLIPVSFLLAIAAGTLLLKLPLSTAAGENTSVLTALFTATTSMCVTGLVVVDTYAHWSLFGQVIILFLIQIGGLGVVSVGAMILLLSKKKFTLYDRLLLGDSLNIDKSRGLIIFLKRIFRGVFLTEALGALLFSLKFVPLLGFARGLWASVFQSVSAFCNAGMDVIGPDSMTGFRDSPLVMIVTMLLIIMGGLGFVVWFDLSDGIRRGIREHNSIHRIFARLSEHSKLVLAMTAFLILAGALCIFAAEYHNPYTLGSMSLPQKILNSLFQSVTCRTAGFASVPQEHLTETSCAVGSLLMFIGGSPVGTAGGIKTVTAFLFFINAFSYIRGRHENVVFHRSVSTEMMRKASAIVFVSLCTAFVLILLLMSRGGIVLTDALYEVISALGTVGLSRNITPHLDAGGRIIIVIAMYLGRIGPISMALFFSKEKDQSRKITHAEGKFYVG